MTYLYRDGGNYKTWYDVVFPNRTGKSAAQLTEEIKKHLISGEYFDQAQAPVPVEYDGTYDPELDHSWLEFHSFQEVDEVPQTEEDVMAFILRL